MIFIVGGPLILAVAFAIWSGILTFGEANNFKTDQDATFSDAVGLEMEVGQEPIEYRTGSEPVTVRKLTGLTKYTHITLRWPVGIDSNWKFIFDETLLPEEESNTELSPALDGHSDAGVEMIKIDPPVLVVPAR